MASGYAMAVVEPTSPTGSEIVRLMEERGTPVTKLVLMGGRRSQGERVEFMGAEYRVGSPDASSFEGVDVVFFAGDAVLTGEIMGHALRAGCIAVDLSTRSNLDEGVPLVVPEVNGDKIAQHRGIIACPRPATVQLALVLAPIHKAARVTKAVITSFHPVSEAGTLAMDELTDQVRDLFSFRDTSSRIFTHQVAFNVLPAVGRFAKSGATQEELAIASELARVLECPGMKLSVTCVRVPVFYGNCASVVVQTEKRVSAGSVREILEHAQGVQVQDDPARDVFPTQIDAAGRDECVAGRIRQEGVFDNAVSLFVACDNVRRGGAINALAIAERALGMYR